MNIKDNFYYIPLYYWYKYNLKNFKILMGYIFSLHLPVILLLITSIEIWEYFLNMILYIIGFLIFIIVYEIFYIHNDFLAKNEKNPTFRYDFNKINVPWIGMIASRGIYVWLLYWIINLFWVQIITHFICLILISIVFFIHNLLNSKYRFITFFLLYVLKIGILFQLLNVNILDYLIYIFLISFIWTIPYFYKKNLSKIYNQDHISMILIMMLIIWLIQVILESNYLYLIISIIIYFSRVIKLKILKNEINNLNTKL